MRTARRLLQKTVMRKKAGHQKAGSAGSNGRKSTKGGEERMAAEYGFHTFTDKDLTLIQTKLLDWYDANKRDLPWRQQGKISDVNQRAYAEMDYLPARRCKVIQRFNGYKFAVWVSEIMLQQTQVATVIDYYNRWMKKWPTLQDLAKAKLEEVNEMWSGLGYYSRGKRLHEGAQKVLSELQGEMPRSCEELQKQLPGVGRYTAGAVASIALGQKTGVVDGNVIRVLSRLRMIGADSTAQTTMDTFWILANGLAECDRPGDLNQSLMELGATVCTPKTPQCSSCPLNQFCKAYRKVESEKKQNASRLVSKETEATDNVIDIECLAESCRLCLPADDPWDTSVGVQNFPRKAKKKAAREQTSSVCVVCKVCQDSQRRFLILQRPQKGLLAGLWEFPSSDMETGTSHPPPTDVLQRLKSDHGILVSHVDSEAHLGEVVHIFSHIHQTYIVSSVRAAEENITVTTDRPTRWLTKEELDDAAVPTAMRKVFKLCSNTKTAAKGVKRKIEEINTDRKKQKSIDSFFKVKS